MMDTVGVKAAMSEISQIKVVAPNMAQVVLDAAIQMHGALGVTLDTPLSTLAAYVRTVRLADGPDEVHRKVVAKFELAKQRAARGEA
jgi:acyl-CoA dehydrogenase